MRGLSFVGVAHVVEKRQDTLVWEKIQGHTLDLSVYSLKSCHLGETIDF